MNFETSLVEIPGRRFFKTFFFFFFREFQCIGPAFYDNSLFVIKLRHQLVFGVGGD